MSDTDGTGQGDGPGNGRDNGEDPGTDRDGPSVRLVLALYAAQIEHGRALTLASDDPDGPHRLRKGLRKLRTALGVFAPGVAAARTLAAEARRLGRIAGPVRDLDVLRQDLVGPALFDRPGDTGLRALDAALASRAASARRALRAELRSHRCERFVAACQALGGPGGAPDIPAPPLAEAAFRKRWKKAEKLGRRFDRLDPDGRHRFRKELKKLRYTLGCGAFPAAGKPRRIQAGRLDRLRQNLGHMNDAQVALDLLQRTIAQTGGGGMDRSAERLRRALRNRRDSALRTVPRDWQRLARARRLH